MRCALLFSALFTAIAAAEPPRALVVEHPDGRTKAIGAAAQLARVGYTVAPLPLDAAPAPGSAEIIVIGSFATERPVVARFLETHARALQAFVAAGGVLVQFTQADQVERSPTFLPDGLSASRTDRDCARLYVEHPNHPLLAGFGGDDLVEIPVHLRSRPSWETFDAWSGFRVLLAHKRGPAAPVLLEAAHGKGRIILTSLFLDKERRPGGDRLGSRDWQVVSDVFFRNLRTYQQLVADGRAPAVAATPPHDPTPMPYTAGASTLAVIPPTYQYFDGGHELFAAQTRWIVNNAERLDIRFACHLGNIVRKNERGLWDRALGFMAVMDGKVPYALATGFTDIGRRLHADSRDSNFSRYFVVDRYKTLPAFAGVLDDEPHKMDNSAWVFTLGTRKFVALVLECGPRKTVVRWANRMLREHKDRTAIIVTHTYLNDDDTLYNWKEHGESQKYNPHRFEIAKARGGVHDGAELWEALISRHANIRLVLCGNSYNDGQARRRLRGSFGNDVHAILTNFVIRSKPGQGFMRLLELQPDGRTLRVKSYSPAHDKWRTDANNQFTIDLAPLASR